MIRPTTVLAALAAFVAPASADHHLQKRALQEARCIPASMVEASRSGDRVAFAVTCRDAPGRSLTLVCTPTRCLADAHGTHSEEDET